MNDLRIFNPENAINKDQFSQLGIFIKGEIDEDKVNYLYKIKTAMGIEVIVPGNAYIKNSILKYIKTQLNNKDFYIKFNKQHDINLKKFSIHENSLFIYKIVRVNKENI
ncbi:MAG: hypothetical protein HOF44_06690 [Pelagibacterales bacterium]|jgi:hypothetical protein|nr:hypothetical protein [Pelagibacterales bacterium]